MVKHTYIFQGTFITLIYITHKKFGEKIWTDYVFFLNGYFSARANEIQTAISPVPIFKHTIFFQGTFITLIYITQKKFGENMSVVRTPDTN